MHRFVSVEDIIFFYFLKEDFNHTLCFAYSYLKPKKWDFGITWITALLQWNLMI